MKKGVLDPMNPERICWGCERYCPANDLACGNGTIRTPHPRELFDDDWQEWAQDRSDPRQSRSTSRSAE